MEFVEAPAFSRYLSRYLSDDDYKELQAQSAQPRKWADLIPGTGGFRKMRWADVRRGKGRRGGLRIIYYYFPADHQIWLMTLYGKNEATDLTAGTEKSAEGCNRGGTEGPCRTGYRTD
jgi:hypothetical protein